MWWHVTFVLCFPHPGYQACTTGLISKQWLNPKCWHSGTRIGPLAGWWGGDTPGGHSQSGLGHMLHPHLAGSLLHLPTSPQPASYHNPPPNLDNWRRVSASGGAESCPLRTQLALTLGTQVSKIPSLLAHPTQPAWAASPGCWILRCPFVQSIFPRTSERDHYTPSSFLQQR